jgi:hypothetical protein
MGTPVAPTEDVDPMLRQLAKCDGGNLLLAGVLPLSFESSHKTSTGSEKKNITRTYRPVNERPDAPVRTGANFYQRF